MSRRPGQRRPLPAMGGGPRAGAGGARWGWGALLLLAGLLTMPSLAYVQLHTGTGMPVRWSPTQLPVTFVIQAEGSDDIPGATDDLAIRRAFGAWDEVPEAFVDLFEIDTPAQRNRKDWWANDLHLVFFDEKDDTGFFPDGSGIVAITSLQVSLGSGTILDADILLNGKQPFSAGITKSAFDVRTIVTHEVGHLLGLGHSPVLGATMAPYVEPGGFHPRTLARDDLAGLQAAYPLLPGGSLRGRVVRAGGTGVVGAHVWARDVAGGRVATGTLSDEGGHWVLDGLPPATYEVSAQPLDGPLTAAPIAGSGVAFFETDFQPATSGTVDLGPGGLATLPPLVVGPDAGLRLVGPPVAHMVHRGESRQITLKVAGWQEPGSVTIPRAGGALSLGEVIFVPPSSLVVGVAAAPAAPLGLYDLRLVDATGARCLAAGYLEVLPQAPFVAAVDPACGSAAGGTLLGVLGSGFTPDAQLDLGDAAATVTSVPTANGLLAELPARLPGTVDVVVTTAGGEESRLEDGFQFVEGLPPALFAVFPWAGSEVGGTVVILLGAGFDEHTEVAFGGVPAQVLALLGPGELRVRTPPLTPGTHPVTVSHPSCGALTTTLPAAFTALSFPDPELTGVEPFVLSEDGGDEVRILGAHFQQGAVVEFFTDLTDGSGGAVVTAKWVNAGQLRCTTPAGPLGRGSVLVRNPDGGVASLPEAVELVPALAGKDVVKGSLEPLGSQISVLDALEGTGLTVTVERLGSGNLLAALTVFGPDGTVAATADPNVPGYDPALVTLGTKRLVLGPVSLPVTGRYTLELTGLSGTSGSYRMRVRERLPKELLTLKLPKAAPLAPGPELVELTFAAKPGAVLQGTLKAKGGLRIRLEALVAPDGTLLAEEVGGVLQGDPDIVSRIQLDEAGRRLTLKSVPLAQLGTHLLRVGTLPGTSGPLTGQLKVKVPKSKELHEP